MKDRDEQATFELWLQKNAEAGWQTHRISDNLSRYRGPQPTPDGKGFSQGCGSAVVILHVAPGGNRQAEQFKMKPLLSKT